MKALSITGLVCSLLCLIGSVIDKDFTESIAWAIVSLNSIKDLLNHGKKY